MRSNSRPCTQDSSGAKHGEGVSNSIKEKKREKKRWTSADAMGNHQIMQQNEELELRIIFFDRRTMFNITPLEGRLEYESTRRSPQG